MNKYPKSYAGVKKLFLAEILRLLAAVLVIGAVVAAFFVVLALGVDTINDPAKLANVDLITQSGALVSAIVMLILLIAAGTIYIISSVIRVIGIIQPINEERSFRFALFCLIVAIVSFCLGSVFLSYSNTSIASMCNAIGDLFNFFVTINIIQGIRNLADRLNNGEVSLKGQRIFLIMAVIYGLMFIAYITGIFAPVLAAIAVIASSILNIVCYFIFLSYLAQAKKMLLK